LVEWVQISVGWFGDPDCPAVNVPHSRARVLFQVIATGIRHQFDKITSG